MNFKYVLIGVLLMIGATFALTMSSPEPVKTVTAGEAAAFELKLADGGKQVELTVDSELPVSISKNFLTVNGVETVNVVAYTKNFEQGFYGITVTAKTSTDTYTYALSVGVTGESTVKLDSVFDDVELVPGEDTELRFVITNTGTQAVQNIIIKSDLLKSYDPEYPSLMTLQAGEEQEFVIKLDVPRGAAESDEIYTITAASGDVETSVEVEVSVVEAEDLSDAINLDVSNDWKAVKNADGTVIGYEIKFTVENEKSILMKDVELEFEGMPAGWSVKGDTSFDIEPVTEEDYTIKVIPSALDEAQVKMKLVYENEVLASQTLTFAGYKVGAATGMFTMGSGSLIVGALLLVVIVLSVLFIRQKNQHVEEVEDLKTKAYLEDLVKKAQTEKKTGKK